MSTKIAIFASGSGSNAENIIQHFAQNKAVEIALILSNKPDAFVLERAKKWQIPSVCFTKSDFTETNNISTILAENNIDFIVLAGFLLKIPATLIQQYPHRIVNIHPALLPKYGGKGMYGQHVHEAVVANKEKESGITIHYVNEQYDEGNIIFQAKCSILSSDTPALVAEKVHQLEYTHFPTIIEKLITD